MRLFIREIQDNKPVEEIYQIFEKTKRSNKNGKIYFQFNLSDKTGTVDTRIWGPSAEQEEQFDRIANGDYVHVKGTTQRFQGALQLIVTKFSLVERDRVDPEDFIRPGNIDTQKLRARLREMLRSIGQPDLLNLADCFLIDEEFMERFSRAPAGVKLHHAYPGGLLEHTTQMMEVALKIAASYPRLNRDLLLLGTFLHDIGKTRELGYDAEMRYTDIGQLLGHPLLGIEMIQEKILVAEELGGGTFDPELAMQLKHMLLSHHGTYENQSAKLPMTLEAMTLHLIDSLDSKLAEFTKYMIEDPNLGSPWTNYIPTIERKLYKTGDLRS